MFPSMKADLLGPVFRALSSPRPERRIHSCPELACFVVAVVRRRPHAKMLPRRVISLGYNAVRHPVKTAAAIRHIHLEDLGAFESVLTTSGYRIQYCYAGVSDLRSSELADCDLLVVLG